MAWGDSESLENEAMEILEKQMYLIQLVNTQA